LAVSLGEFLAGFLQSKTEGLRAMACSGVSHTPNNAQQFLFLSFIFLPLPDGN
jgi:hypothetical protein